MLTADQSRPGMVSEYQCERAGATCPVDGLAKPSSCLVKRGGGGACVTSVCGVCTRGAAGSQAGFRGRAAWSRNRDIA